MAKGLKSVIRYHEWIVDEKRRALGQLLEREEQLVAERVAQDEELVIERDQARADPAGTGSTFTPYLQAWEMRRDRTEAMLADTRALIDQARDDLADAFKELKTYEIAQKAREEAERKELARREQMVLDEIAQTLHLRKGQ